MNIDKIREHYDHAREKHPYFCDKLFVESGRSDFKVEAKEKLYECRKTVDLLKTAGRISSEWLLECEFAEAKEAYANGDMSAAVEECYDAIAIILRVIDVIEAQKMLGKPDEKGETK